ncbi:MAG TPA: helix-turn-helix domain-containing protein [Polyangiaceae bacterium]|nr:helix-turn-helix domain-containing protein [Polyangiaceae bacterium]
MALSFGEAQRAVWRSGLSNLQKSVFLAILDHWSQKNQRPFPGVGRLGWWTSLSRSTVLRTLQSLETAGVLVVDRANGKANAYDVSAAFEGRLPVSHRHGCQADTGIQETPDQCPTDTGTSVPQTPEGSHMKDPKKDPRERAAVAAPLTLVAPTLSAKKAAKRTSSKPKRWTRVPDAFEPKGDHREIARVRGVNIDDELQRFRDHEFAKPRCDADAAFRNWLRAAFQQRPGRGPAQPNHGVVDPGKYAHE